MKTLALPLVPHASRRSPSPFAALALPLLLSACGAETVADAAPRFTSRDSAGVEIVESHAPLWNDGEAWTIDSLPILTIGSLDGDPLREFGRVEGVVRLADGSVAVLDGQTKNIRVFDAQGAYVRTIGGPGQGPGELDAPRWLQRLPDGNLQLTDRLDRVRYAATGELISDELLRYERTLEHGRYSTECGSLPLFHADRVILCNWTTEEDLPQEGLHRPLKRLVFLPWDLSRADTAASLLGLEQYALQVGGQRQFLLHRLFSRGISTFARDHFYVAETGRYRIEQWRLDGGLERVILRSGVERPPTPEMVDSAYQDAADQLRRENQGNLGLVRGRVHIPSSMPILGSLTIDSDGFLWARSTGVEGEPSGFDVFDPQGRLLGRVGAPPIQVHDIGSDYLLGVRRDELGVSHVEMYRVRRQTP